MKIHSEKTAKNAALKDRIAELHKQILALCPTKILPEVSNIGQPSAVQSPQPNTPSARPMSVPTAAALKMGVGFPLTNLPGTKDDTRRILSTQRSENDELLHECGICKRCNDQHMLAKCDTCHFYYHLGCLNPPLTRHPKKSKLYGWQCSECDKSDDSDAVVDIPKGPRKSRTRFSKDGSIVPVDPNLSASSTDGNNSLRIGDTSSNIRKQTERIPSKGKQIQTNASFDQNSKPIKDGVEFAKKAKQSNQSLNKTDPSEIVAPSPKREETEHQVKENKAKPDSDRSQLPKPGRIQSPRPAQIKSPRAARIQSPRPTDSPTKSLSDKGLPAPNSTDPKKEIKQKSSKKVKKDKSEQSRSETSDQTLPTIESSQTESNVTNELSTVAQKSESADEPMSQCLEPTKVNDEHMESMGLNESADHIHKLNRKRRKEKHKNKYSSDNEKSPTKEHKRKRKKKSHEMENPNDSIPKIKIKVSGQVSLDLFALLYISINSKVLIATKYEIILYYILTVQNIATSW